MHTRWVLNLVGKCDYTWHLRDFTKNVMEGEIGHVWQHCGFNSVVDLMWICWIPHPIEFAYLKKKIFIEIWKPNGKTKVQRDKIKTRIYSEIDMITKSTLNDMESKMGIGRVYVYAIEFSIFFCKAGPLWIKGGDEISGNRSLGDNGISYIYKKLNIINTIATIQSMAKLSRWRRLDHW